MFDYFKKRKRQHALKYYSLPDTLWSHTVSRLPFLERWTPPMLAQLRELTTLFLLEKTIFSGHESLEMTPEIRTLIAAQACTLILHRDLDDFEGWDNIIVHPECFPRSGETMDEHGLVHHDDEFVSGEAWENGPVLLSWPDVEDSLDFDVTGVNLVIHEFAHKIDMKSGETDGVPPLANSGEIAQWEWALKAAFQDFCRRVDVGEQTVIDPYASEHASEFFAVCAEIYVAAPEQLHDIYPDFYRQMNRFFRLWADQPLSASAP